ncbi:hypothetical protein ACFU9B_42330 [Streptomyces sp. NPDC057592]|uniref:hypothetical protein n=1 Tax=unclassified Streptomyces TaxID=2593676 RepID=UPI0036988443
MPVRTGGGVCCWWLPPEDTAGTHVGESVGVGPVQSAPVKIRVGCVDTGGRAGTVHF